MALTSLDQLIGRLQEIQANADEGAKVQVVGKIGGVFFGADIADIELADEHTVDLTLSGDTVEI